MKKISKAQKICAIVLAVCLSMGATCTSVFATQTYSQGWIEVGADEKAFYINTCLDNANRSDFNAMVSAGRDTYERSSATERTASGIILCPSMSRSRITIETQDWATGTKINGLSGASTEGGFIARMKYSKPISVFACTEAWGVSGSDYVCVYPTSIAW